MTSKCQLSILKAINIAITWQHCVLQIQKQYLNNELSLTKIKIDTLGAGAMGGKNGNYQKVYSDKWTESPALSLGDLIIYPWSRKTTLYSDTLLSSREE